MSHKRNFAVPPNAARVWRGFRLPSMQLEQFQELHGTVFIPATVKLQTTSGLESYVPTVLAGVPGKPDSVPDETAVVFWKSQSAYHNAFNRLAVRTYKLTHGGIFDFQNRRSRSGFPVLFSGTLDVDTPVYLFDKPAVWMYHTVKHLAAARPSEITPKKFLEDISKILSTIKNDVELEGAVACAGNDYFVYWELIRNNSSSGIPLLIKEALTDWSWSWSRTFTAKPTHLEHGLWDEWKGMDIHGGESFNMQFDRRRRAAFAKKIEIEKLVGLEAYVNTI
jgi:hypothetical protein